MTDRDAYIGFSAFPGIGPLRFKMLIEYFGSAQKAWVADKQTLLRINLGEKLTAKLLDFRNTFQAYDYIQKLLQDEINIITRIDKGFPKKLLEIPDPPIALYVNGKLENAYKKIIGVVGTRKPTSYGKQITASITRDLCLQDFVIVSGLARGVDAIAHRTALECGVITIAVLGCGVDIIYPPEHKQLYQDIINSGGAVISEVPPQHTVLKGLFPARNRIISGLSQGVVVTEGAQDSGSLITARLALDQGREVFAIPGPITSYLSVGPTNLIKQGAKATTCVKDILEELNVPQKQMSLNNNNKNLNNEEQHIVELLNTGELHFDELVRLSRISVSSVSTILTTFELSGIIRALGNGKYGLNSG